MGQAKRRGTYEERKAEGVLNAIRAEAEREEARLERIRQENLRMEEDIGLRAVRDDRGRVVSPSGYRRTRLSHSALLAVAMLAGRVK